MTVTATAKRRRKQARLKNGRKLTKSELIDRMIAMRSGKKTKR